MTIVHSAKGLPEPQPSTSGDHLIAAAISQLPAADLRAMIGPEQSLAVAGFVDWLIAHGRSTDIAAEDLIGGICDRLTDLGLPLDRFGSSAQMLDSELDAIGRIWLRGKGVTERTYVRSTDVGPADTDQRFLTSPFYRASQTGRWVELWVPTADDDLFAIVPEFKAAGYTHYICVPNLLMNGSNAWLTLATRAPAGFSPEHCAVIALVVPAIGMLVDMRTTWTALGKLLRTYVGDEPRLEILRGNTKRGQVSTIRSAMLFADMRDSVGHTAHLSAVEAVGVFNALFDCLVPPIEGRRGEVLKYIGDGLLAIFREGRPGACDAADRAMAAAEEALAILAARNRAHPDEVPIHVGIALHYGEAAYGTVGSGVRLDFTVIGKDVGLASRMADMNRSLGESLLMSGDFVRRLHRGARRIGAFAARGLREPIEVYGPQDVADAGR
jgi:adenylate cyclase